MIRRMKTWTLRIRAVDKEIFKDLKIGKKSVETRAATVRYRPIQEGDSIRFVCGEKSFTKRITSKRHFKTVDAMAKKISFKRIMPHIDSVADMKKQYTAYSGYENKIKKYGLFAFELT